VEYYIINELFFGIFISEVGGGSSSLSIYCFILNRVSAFLSEYYYLRGDSDGRVNSILNIDPSSHRFTFPLPHAHTNHKHDTHAC